MKRRDRRGTFTAIGEDGSQHTIVQYVDILNAGTGSDPNAECDGMSSLRTASGLSVNRIDKGEYEVVQTGMVLRSDDPDAL